MASGRLQFRAVLWAMLAASGVTWVACGGKTEGGHSSTEGSAGGAGASGSGSSNGGKWEFTPYPLQTTNGCQLGSPDGCERCCTEWIESNALACEIRTPSSSSMQPGACPAGCERCASCASTSEASLRQRLQPPVPSCNCESVPLELDACFAQDSCACFCGGVRADLRVCPQLAGLACDAGVYCTASIFVERAVYQPDDLLNAVLSNASPEDVFWDACNTLVVKSYSDSVATPVPLAGCNFGDELHRLAAGGNELISLSLPSDTPTGDYRLEYRYYLGCDSTALSDVTKCTGGPIKVTSDGIGVLRP